MRRADAVRLVALAAIWGASFLFMRIAAPAIGPLATAELRMLIAGGTLAAWFAFIGFDPQWRRWWRYYLGIGLINSAAPFLLYAYSALHLSVGLMAVINATSPMWGALLSTLVLKDKLTVRRMTGLLLGIAGVALVSGPQAADAWLAIAACLGGAFCYGLAGTVLRLAPRDTTSRGMAVGTQTVAGLLLLPILFTAPAAVPSLPVIASVLGIGILCSGVAYVMYFRLIADIGPTSALTVTYLIPVFGVLWGVLFLGEALTATTLGGALIVVAGTVLVLRG
jgi:drug/metabolite transporter (DMT)-like permease